MTLDFFMNTVGAMFKRGTAHPTLTAEGREIVKKKHNLTDEELDDVLEALGKRMTKQINKDMDTLQARADREQTRRNAKLRERRVN